MYFFFPILVIIIWLLFLFWIILIIFEVNGHVLFIFWCYLYLRFSHWRFISIKRPYDKRICSFFYLNIFSIKHFIIHIIIISSFYSQMKCHCSFSFLIIIKIVILSGILKWISMILNQVMSPLHCYFSSLIFING